MAVHAQEQSRRKCQKTFLQFISTFSCLKFYGNFSFFVIIAILFSAIPFTEEQYTGATYNSTNYNGSYNNYAYGQPYSYAYPYPVAGRGIDYGAYNNFCNNVSNFYLTINNTNAVTNTNENNQAQVMNENNLNNPYNISVKTYIYGPLCTFYAGVVYPPAPPPQPIQYIIYQMPPQEPEEVEEEDDEGPEIEVIVDDGNATDDSAKPPVQRPAPYVPPPASVSEFEPPPVPQYGPAVGQYASQVTEYDAAGSDYSEYQSQTNPYVQYPAPSAPAEYSASPYPSPPVYDARMSIRQLPFTTANSPLNYRHSDASLLRRRPGTGSLYRGPVTAIPRNSHRVRTQNNPLPQQQRFTPHRSTSSNLGSLFA
ncbi:uncharacterized protein LOC129583096 isoform X1 [Paramacrobiotus metropolitanus]|uniref:uncharacterized protein LOC129583096 isoform X1 n=1 Tax=Paramacrobiotus metropolitanus TaxID=2943436 RepID=UPI002445B472|nr:uncharacterized protein LOC129583096 isoform X1 [Paramacrobiotus metropolitanus]